MKDFEKLKELFYKPIKVNAPDKNILFWGCLHHGHNPEHWDVPLWKQRGFNSVEEHDAAEIERWNTLANKDTIGFLLGDTILGKGAAERLEVLFNKLNFNTLYIMPGNHYSGWRQHFERCENNIKYIEENKKVIFVPNYLEAFINGVSVVLSHYPILSWNGQGGGSIMLFSHVHGGLIDTFIGKLYLEKYKCLETSVEVNPFPLTFSDVRKKLLDKQIETPDHHGKHTQNPF